MHIKIHFYQFIRIFHTNKNQANTEYVPFQYLTSLLIMFQFACAKRKHVSFIINGAYDFNIHAK